MKRKPCQKCCCNQQTAAGTHGLPSISQETQTRGIRFGEEQLGEIAREYEKQLRQVSREDYRALIADADRAMRDSA